MEDAGGQEATMANVEFHHETSTEASLVQQDVENDISVASTSRDVEVPDVVAKQPSDDDDDDDDDDDGNDEEEDVEQQKEEVEDEHDVENPAPIVAETANSCSEDDPQQQTESKEMDLQLQEEEEHQQHQHQQSAEDAIQLDTQLDEQFDIESGVNSGVEEGVESDSEQQQHSSPSPSASATSSVVDPMPASMMEDVTDLDEDVVDHRAPSAAALTSTQINDNEDASGSGIIRTRTVIVHAAPSPPPIPQEQYPSANGANATDASGNDRHDNDNNSNDNDSSNSNDNDNSSGNYSFDNDINSIADDLTLKTLPIDEDDTAPADVDLPPQDYHRFGGFGFAMFYDHNDLADSDDDNDDGLVSRSHICCWILCDCKRACVFINTISFLSTLIAFLTYIAIIFGGGFIRTGDDDEYPANDRTTRIVVVCIYAISLVCYALGIYGALRYNYALLSIASCRYIVEIVAAGILGNIWTMILCIAFLYPHIVLSYEFWHRIITPITYPYQEYSCCCRTNSVMIAMEMERRRRQRAQGQRLRQRQR